MNIDDSVAAATATVGTDVVSGKNYAQKPNLRHLRKIGLVGGNAVNEAKVDLYIGGVYSGSFLNSVAAVATVLNDHMKEVNIGVLPNERIEFKIVVAPTVSPLVWRWEMDDL